MHTGFRWGNLREEDHLEDAGLHERIILKWIFEKRFWESMNLIEQEQVRDRWRALVNAVINLRISQNAWNFLTS